MLKLYYTLFISLFTISIWSQDYKRMIAEGTYTVQEIQAAAKLHFEMVGTERGKGYKPYKRWEYFALRSMDETGMLKTPSFYFNELEKYNSTQNDKGIYSKTTEGTWEQLGPTDWNQTSGWNPGVGRITSMAFENGNTNHIIVGSPTGGIWKTTDGGTNWNVLSDNLSNLVVYSLAIDPTNASTYYWGSAFQIFKSTDAGATWNPLATVANGFINKILIDPTNINKMYCSVEYRGVYKSTDAGVTWSKIHANSTNGYDIEFKPGDTNTIYASGNQFFKSVDGGSTFNVVNDILEPFPYFWDQEFITGTTYWLPATENGNATVTPKTGDLMATLYFEVNPGVTTRLVTPSLNLSGSSTPELKFSFTQADWEGDQDELRVLYKTSAEGAWVELANYTTNVTSWTDITLGLPNASSDYYIAFEGSANYGHGVTLDDVSIEDSILGTVFEDGFESGDTGFGVGAKMIGVSPADPSIVYVLEASGDKFGGFYQSSNSGSSFTKLDHLGKNYFGYSSDADDDRGQAPRDMDIAVNPLDINDVHIAGILSWRSTDGGHSFNVTSQWVPGTALSQNIGYCHADIDILNYLDGKLYVGSDGGIFVANDPTTVSSTYYTDLTAGLGIRQFYRIGVSQTDPVIVTGGSQDNGTSVMNTSETWSDWLGADGMETFVDKNDSNILYGTSQYGTMYKSMTGGNSYGGLTQPEGKGGDNSWNWVTPFEQDPIFPNTIYVAFDEVYRSTDGGTIWSSISQNFGVNIGEFKIAPSNNLVMYAGRNNALYKTTDGGATDWTSLTGFSGNINSIAIHPSDPNKVAIATTSSDKVYVSVDGGINWTPYLYDLPNFSAYALAWQDNGDDGLYVGMNYGAYYIDNTTSNSWQPFSNNLPNVIINELEINTVTNQIYAATYGRGLWRSNIYDSSLSTTDFELNSISLYPNPSTKEVNLSWNKNDDVSIRIFNSIGKLVYFSKNKNLSKNLNIDVSKYASGLYFVKINNLKGFVTKKLVVE